MYFPDLSFNTLTGDLEPEFDVAVLSKGTNARRRHSLPPDVHQEENA